MGHKYVELAFTDAVKTVQTELNSRAGYERMAEGEDYNYLLSQREADFIQARDSFYMASVSETNWPYVQHRGGPGGFLKVLDEKTIGFADFSGNRQYISTGNFRHNDRVSLILMDYPNRARMKILGRISVVAEDDWQMLASLEIASYRARVERGFLIHIEAFDWNCPQHITPRFTEETMQKLLAPLQEENERLKKDLAAQIQQKTMPAIIGSGPLELTITGIRQLTPRVRAFELRDPGGLELPKVEAGAHIQLPVLLDNGELTTRHYSICSNPARRDIYEVAVLRENDGKGGSKAIHENYQIGQILKCDLPNNFFKLEDSNNKAILIAGGIGITPIKAMAQSLKAKNIDLNIHYAGRSKSEMPFRDRLKREFGENLFLYASAEQQRMDISSILKNASKTSTIYVCGPNRLINAVINAAQNQNIDEKQIRFERFTAKIEKESKPFTVKLQHSNTEISVNGDETIIEAINKAGLFAAYSCQTGVCKTCVVKVIDGEPEHNDSVLSEVEKHEQDLFCPCVSRAKSDSITLDL